MNTQFLYRGIAKFYDLIDVIYFKNYENSPRKIMFESVGDTDRVLDLCAGTATGAIQIAAGKPGTKVVAVDLSKAMLRIAKEKSRKQKIPNIKLCRMDATMLRLPDHCFDKVVLSLVLHETEEVLAQRILAEVRRVLKQDGELLVTEWERSDRLLRKIAFFPVEILEPRTYYKFIKKDLNVYFKEQGFTVVQEYHCDYSHVLKLKIRREEGWE